MKGFDTLKSKVLPSLGRSQNEFWGFGIQIQQIVGTGTVPYPWHWFVVMILCNINYFSLMKLHCENIYLLNISRRSWFIIF